MDSTTETVDSVDQFNEAFEESETKERGSGIPLFKDLMGTSSLSKLKVACSLQREDIVVIDLLKKANVQFTAYCLDTGRLHPETYQMMDRVRSFFDIDLEVYTPNPASLEPMVRSKGLYSFKLNVENRKECCYIRKVEGNNRALAPAVCDSYVTGIRRQQSELRASTPALSLDEAHKSIPKFAPLILWTHDEIAEYIAANKLPDHPLYNQGYTSIGCQPCTRAVDEGETDDRAGRWWWENPDHKECGLHFVKS